MPLKRRELRKINQSNLILAASLYYAEKQSPKKYPHRAEPDLEDSKNIPQGRT
jgi:hypothetical protein